MDLGSWPIWLNAIFNGFAHYLFILCVTIIFIPVFVGRLSALRDFYGASFFKPLARTSFTLAIFSGLFLNVIYYSDAQLLNFEHKNLFFRYCQVEITGLLTCLLLSMVMEWPFRLLGRLVFSKSQRRLLRLKGELAKELNTTSLDDEIFGDDIA
jgi:hypothetical protein